MVSYPSVKNRSRTKPNGKKRKSLTYKSMLLILACVLSVLITAIFIRLYFHSGRRMEALSRELVDLRSAMNIDSVRQHKIQKVLAIITRYNPSLSSMEAYDIAGSIYEMSIKYTNLDVDLLCAVITHESAKTWDPRIVSKAGAMGLMQVMPVTGMFVANYEGLTWTTPEEVLFNPVYNIRLGSRLLSSLIEKYNLEGALIAYNGGEKLAATWLTNGRDSNTLWKETREYVPAIQTLYKNYLSEKL